MDPTKIVRASGESQEQVLWFKNSSRKDATKKRAYVEDIETADTALKKKRIKSLANGIKSSKRKIEALKSAIEFHQEAPEKAISKPTQASEEPNEGSDASSDNDDDSGESEIDTDCEE